MQEKMNIVIVGHVDHGKSTIIGRLLADTGSLPEGKLEAVKENCRINSKPFEYAFLLDALKDEQSQGITIDAARVFFHTKKRNYIILDAPGHIEFLRNMITGAARAEAALLVIDAHEGIKENSRRHGYMLSLLGIKQIVVLVNKMDLIDYDKDKFGKIMDEFNEFLSGINVKPVAYIPVSGMQGDNIQDKGANLGWYQGNTVLQALDEFQKEAPLINQPFRMPVQDIYKFTALGDSRRIVAGTIESGKISVGDEMLFYPSGKKSKVKSVEAFNADPGITGVAGQAAGFTLTEQIYITRGELAVKKGDPAPKVTTRILVSLFWLGNQPMVKGREYIIKIGTARVYATLEEVRQVIDASSLDGVEKDEIEKHDVAECVIHFKKGMAFDLASEISATGRFVVVDNFEISGGGIIREALSDKQSWARDMVQERNAFWEKSKITCTERAIKYNQKATLLLITGPEHEIKKDLAKAIEEKLFTDGKFVYYLGMENLLFGLDADLKQEGDPRKEHIRRLGELANIILDAGLILVVTTDKMHSDDLELIQTMVTPDWIETILVDEESGDPEYPFDLHIKPDVDLETSVDRIRDALRRRGIIYSPW